MVRRRSAAAPPRARSRSPAHPGRDQGAPKAHGPVAQLVEQRVYTAAVVGSNPAGSTTGLLDGPLSRAVRVSASGSRAALRARGRPYARPAPGGVILVMSPQLTSCQVGSRGSSADGFRRAELAQREVGWILLRWARITQAGPSTH